jgi:hypothetical protein
MENFWQSVHYPTFRHGISRIHVTSIIAWITLLMSTSTEIKQVCSKFRSCNTWEYCDNSAQEQYLKRLAPENRSDQHLTYSHISQVTLSSVHELTVSHKLSISICSSLRSHYTFVVVILPSSTYSQQVSRLLIFTWSHSDTHTTVGRTPLDEVSALRRNFYLTTKTLHNRQTSMPPVGFEPTIPAKRSAADRAATGIDHYTLTAQN